MSAPNGYLTTRWSAGQVPRTNDPELERYLSDRFLALERALNPALDRLEVGPIPGAYVTLFLRPNDGDTGDGVAVTAPPTAGILGQGMIPVGLTAAISPLSAGSVTLNVKFLDHHTLTWIDLLPTTLTVAQTAPVYKNSR